MKSTSPGLILRACSILLTILLFTPASHADNITVYADASGTSCSITDQNSAPLTVFVLHTNVPGATASFLSVTESAGFSATFVEESIPYYHAGTFRDGVTVVYQVCLSGSFVIGTITYQGHGTSQACSKLDTAVHPYFVGLTPYPVTEDCSFTDYEAPSLMPLYVNPSSECACAVRTEPATWGRVKALYRR